MDALRHRYNVTIDARTGLPPAASLNAMLWQDKCAAMEDDARLIIELLDASANKLLTETHEIHR